LNHVFETKKFGACTAALNLHVVEAVESFTENNEETRDLCPVVQKFIMSSKRENVFKKYSLENQLC
jgi:hypothetical protein